MEQSESKPEAAAPQKPKRSEAVSSAETLFNILTKKSAMQYAYLYFGALLLAMSRPENTLKRFGGVTLLVLFIQGMFGHQP